MSSSFPFVRAVLCAAIFSTAMSANAADESRPVLLVTIDGLHPSYVLDSEKYGIEVPVLKSFVRGGSYASGVTNVSPTVTYPNHIALVTGVGPEKNGIYTNTVFDPEGVEKGAWNWYGAQIKAPTLWDVAKAKGMVTASVLWPVSVGSRSIDYNVPEFWYIRGRSRANLNNYLLDAVVSPRGFMDTLKPGGFSLMDAAEDEGEEEFDKKLTELAIAMIDRARPDLLTVHLVGLDGAQHAGGPLPENDGAKRTLERLDALVGRLVDAERKAHPDAVIAIASDHGFLPVRNYLNINAALSSAGLIETDAAGKLKSWKAFSWGSGGSASVVVKDPKDRETMAKVGSILRELAAKPGNGIAAVFEGEQAVRAGALPQASFVVDCQPGYAIGGALTGEVLQRQGKLTGAHGYLNTHPEMNSAFFVMGPGIKAGKNLGQIDIRQVAPTLAAELDVSLSDADLRPLPIK